MLIGAIGGQHAYYSIRDALRGRVQPDVDGRAAMRVKTVPEAQPRGVIAIRLPNHKWPQKRLLIPAVDVETGALMVFDKGSGVSLVNAVAASCAVPMVWPPMSP